MSKYYRFFSHTTKSSQKFPIIAIFLSLFISGCTTQISSKSNISGDLKKQTHLSKITDWTWSGKFVLKNRKKSKLGGLTWQKKGLNNYIFLKGPMGIKIDSFLISEGRILRHKTREREIDPTIRLSLNDLPLDTINLWLLGIVPEAFSDNQNHSGKFASHQYKDWRITYKNWKTFNGYSLPSEILLKRKFMQMKLITLNWISEKND